MDPKVKEALNFIRKYINKYGRIAIVSSWGKDSIVVLHLVLQVKPDIPVIFVKTPFKPKETLELRDKIVAEWNLNYIEYESKMVQDKDFMENVVIKPKLWKTNPESCCQLFKVEPIQRAVRELKLEAWFSGLRATESEKRKLFKKVHRQGAFVRLHPLHDWTEADIWRYIACHNLPVHPWYAEGYRSIGCACCSAVGGKHERDGRWKGTSKQGCGCGIHDTCLLDKKEEDEE